MRKLKPIYGGEDDSDEEAETDTEQEPEPPLEERENTTKLTLFKFSHQGPWLSYRMNRQYGASD
eukprot:SAG25_NODE_773_length_5438_cov_13.294624_2_plen_64_part_00